MQSEECKVESVECKVKGHCEGACDRSNPVNKQIGLQVDRHGFAFPIDIEDKRDDRFAFKRIATASPCDDRFVFKLRFFMVYGKRRVASFWKGAKLIVTNTDSL